MRTAAYLRVSTNDQTVDNQLPAILDYCKAHWWLEPEIYRENESAWRAGHQQELARLLNDLRTGKRKYDYLVVWSLDRLSRQGIGALLQLVNTFEIYGCKVVSMQESWVAESGQMRELFIAMAAWAAKFESDRRSERTLAGMARAKAAGKPIGKRGKDNGKRKRTGYLLRYAGVKNG